MKQSSVFELQQWPAKHRCIFLIVEDIGGRFTYNWGLVGCSIHIPYTIYRMQVYVPSNLASNNLISVQVEDPNRNTDFTVAWKNFLFISWVRDDFQITFSELRADQDQHFLFLFVWLVKSYTIKVSIGFLRNVLPFRVLTNYKLYNPKILKPDQPSFGHAP